MIKNNGTSLDTIKTQIYETLTEIKTNLNPYQKEVITESQDEETLETSDINLILKQLKYYIKILIEEKNNNNNPIYNRKNYKQLESYIIKLEDDIRYLMKREYQSIINRDSLEMKIRAYMQIEEEYENLKEKVKFEDGKFLDNDRKDNEIIILRRENSNLKKEINKLEKESKEVSKLQEQVKDYENKYMNGEEIIKGLKYKVRQLTNKVTELEEEIRNNTINHNNTYNEIKYSNNEKNLVINDSNYNSRNKIDLKKMNERKFSLEKFSLNKNNINLKHVTNYKFPNSMINYESTKNNNINNNTYSMKTIDNNKLIVSTYNKIYNKINKNIIIPIRNDIYKRTKKIKSSSVPMKDDNDKSEMLNKYLSGSKTNNKYITHIKTKSLNKIGKNINGYLLMSNSTVGRKTISKEHYNPYEHSALNIMAINKKK